MFKKHHREGNAHIIANVILMAYSILAILPLFLLIGSSLSNQQDVMRYGYTIMPRQFDLSAYNYLSQHVDQIGRAYVTTIGITIVGTAVGLITTALIAYPLSRKDLPGRRIFLFLVFFTILFNGGLFPTYYMYTKVLGIKNTYLGLLIPNLLTSGMYILMMRTFFTTNIPQAVLESARLDGANEFQMFALIVLPMGKTILATIGLFIGMGYWNDWYNGMLYLTKPQYYNIQNLLTRMMQNIKLLTENASVAGRAGAAPLPSVTVRMAIAVIGVLPVVIIFPFVQQFFVKGIAFGSIKE